MKPLKEIIKRIPFSAYTKKVDSAIRFKMKIEKIKVLPVIITFRTALDADLEAKVKRLGLKVKYHLPLINGLSGRIPMHQIDSFSSLFEIHKIYYDGKAQLAGAQSAGAHPAVTGLPEPVPQEQRAWEIKSSYLSGKGVTVAFIDSGVYPHPDLTRPRNRIIAFKDFIRDLEAPYDDHGHGTACIGAGFGAAMDGRFRAFAYDANIVCAKAFDSLGNGFYSDILAAMQWIVANKEKYAVKILVLPFGTVLCDRNFDVLRRGTEEAWKSGLFVCTCTGNLGPSEGSITSPGSCSSSLTAAACSTEELQPRAASFSGCGPLPGKADKPDVIMPGCRVQTLAADTAYLPKGRGGYNIPPLSLSYREASGTSVSASLAAAAAALLYQNHKDLKPDDVKSILKTCTHSINELKRVQGMGMIHIRKLEEFKK